jgi:hypothetical protein
MILLLTTVGCTPSPVRGPPASEAPGGFLDPFVDVDDLGDFSAGLAFDAIHSPEEFLALNGRTRGRIPPPPVAMKDPAIVVSLQGLTCRVFDRKGDAERVYPIGAGVRRKLDRRSITPVGTFSTHEDPNDNWFYIWERRVPEYFAGLPFLRINARNDAGYPTYGLHGPITEGLLRGYVSHGCVRMRPDDIKELFAIAYRAPGAPVIIQDDADYNRFGILYDVPYPREHRPLGDLPRVRTAGSGEVSVAVELPPSGRVGEGIVVESRVSGSGAGRVRYVLYNENATWDGDLASPLDASKNRTAVSFSSAGSRAVYAIALNTDHQPVGFARREISIE